jgi:hypothetical protein
MIQVLVTPRRLVAGQQARLDIRFSNTGGGSCMNVVFTLGLPPGVRLIGGKERVDIGMLRAGGSHVHSVTVQAHGAGEHTLTSPNFSYRNEDDESVRVSDWRVTVAVEPAPPPAPPPVARPAPRLRVEHEGGPLALGKWDVLSVLVRNASGIPVSDVSVAISGPVETNGKRSGIAALRDGQKARAKFSIRVDWGGLVPVSVRLTYSYPDGLGSLRQTSQEEQLNVLVEQSEKPKQTTVLFLAASPRDLEPIRPDEELSKIEKELRLGQNRDGFLLVAERAAQLSDISRALVRYKPNVVHFSGHGNEDGSLYVEDELGYSRPTNTEGMAELFGLHKATIKCVIVNACHSERLARAVTRHIDHGIGMSAAIGDRTSIKFSVDFYQSFFDGMDVTEAFRHARSVLHADVGTAPEYQTPVLYPPGPE